jgi:hypothetical protein
MKRLFFVLLFALTALFFTACSSGGSGGSSDPSLPAIEDVFPQPVDLPDTTPVPSSFVPSRGKEYKVASQTVIDEYIDALSALAWLTCDTASSYCYGSDTENSPNYDAYISGYESYGEYFIVIQLSTSDVFIEDTLFANFPPVSGSIEYDGMSFNYSFSADAEAGDYKDAYIELLEARGFTEDPSYPGEYTKKLSGGYAAYFWYYLYGTDLSLYTEVYKEGIAEPAAAAYAYADLWGSFNDSQKTSYVSDLITGGFTYNAAKGLYEKSIGDASLTVSIDAPFSASPGEFYITPMTSAADGSIIYDYSGEFPSIGAIWLGSSRTTIYEGNASEWFALQASHHIYDGYTHDVIDGGVDRYCTDIGDMYCYEYKVDNGVYSVSENYTDKTFWERIEAE